MTMRVSIMGSTGSVGRSALSVMAHAGSVSEDPVFSIDTLTANSDVDTLARQSITYNARLAVVADDRAYKELKSQLAGTGIEVAAGADAIAEAAARPVDRLLAAIVGIAGLRSTYSALKAGAKREEILDALGVAILMGGGPSMVYALEAHSALEQFEGEFKD